MSSEIRRSLLIEPQKPVDTGIWESFYNLEARAIPTYELLVPPMETLDKAKTAFFDSGRKHVPDLRPSHLDLGQLAHEEAGWTELKEYINGLDTDEWIKQVYLWRVNEQIAKLRMTNSAQVGDMRRFAVYNKFIYGTPDQAIFKATADWFRDTAAKELNHESSEVGQAAARLLSLVPDMGGNKHFLEPSPETFEVVREQHFKEAGFYTLLLAGVVLPEAGKVSKQAGDQAIRQVLRNIESDLEILPASGGAFSVARNEGGLKVPEQYNWVFKRFVGLALGHEAGHELEFQNGIRQPVRLFGTGTDRYENGNEGRAVIREQVQYATFDDFAKTRRWRDIMRRHFAVSLCYGLSGKAMNFAETFEVINAIDRFWERKAKPAEVELADAKADGRSWDLLATKIFCGTDGQAGTPYMKNGVYLTGNVYCWKLAESNPGIIDKGDLGKFDITNPRHLYLAQQAGVLPKM